ncbi:hypothetical protein SRABI106_04623 [Rahnella aquatilis]|nr:hypothetical protein SRABI106_04623 [Rahnella aquatilis]
MPALIVSRHQGFTARQLRGNRRRHRRQRIRHVISLLKLRSDKLICQRHIGKGQIMQAGVTQRTFTDIFMHDTVCRQTVSVVNRQEFIRHFVCQTTGDRIVNSADRFRIDNIEQFSNFIFRRQSQNLRRQRRINVLIQQYRAERICHMQRQGQWLFLLMSRYVQFDVNCQQALRRIPAGEIITRVLHQESQLMIAPFVIEFHRCGEFT